MKRFRMGEIYRYARPAMEAQPVVDGLANFHFVTHLPGLARLQLERGISAPAQTDASDGQRVAAVLLSSNAHKRGSIENPWHDEIEPEEGFARYYGDNRTPGRDPGLVQGNQLLLRQFELHSSPYIERRRLAAPLLLFRSDRKGYKEFCGLGLLTGARRVTQFSSKNGGYFTNYLFDIAIFTLTEEDESVNLLWIKDRRDPTVDATTASFAAPYSWRQWIQFGAPVVEKLRRRVTRYQIASREEQLPDPGTPQRNILETVYKFYDGRKHRFEALASLACESAIRETGATYRRGWLTQSTADGGLDFVGRVDVGEGFARTRLVLLGQAKCERIDSPTGGVHVARTVARLRRGWLGAYVTTSFFSPAVQREVYEDQYPVMLINGQRLADEITRLQLAGGHSKLENFLLMVDSGYEEQISPRHPEEILWD
jgi:hypothetical protein